MKSSFEIPANELTKRLRKDSQHGGGERCIKLVSFRSSFRLSAAMRVRGLYIRLISVDRLGRPTCFRCRRR